MIFEKGFLYHIYNQGNNKQKIFYTRENYIFFIKKMHEYILPYADVLAWCLMPNHFHLMVLVKWVESQGFTSSEALTKKAHNQAITNRTFNDSIGILLRTYTRAINKQKRITGSIFRKGTKAECINCFKGNKPVFIQNNFLINNHISEKQYPQICFNYIHQNPVKAKLIKNAIDWEFSSAMDYKGLRNEKLINKEVAKEYVIL
jgi:REP-associated tyrosine transposase